MVTSDLQSHHLIENHSIFGDYKQNENRVTCALLHILQNGGTDMIGSFIETFGGEFVNNKPLIATQVILKKGNKDIIDRKGKACCADGIIVSDCQYKIFIESKIEKNSIKQEQLDAYRCNVNMGAGEYLLYITPDSEKPVELDESDYWMNWNHVMTFLRSFSSPRQDTMLVFLVENFEKLIDKVVLYKENTAKFDQEKRDVEQMAKKKISGIFKPSIDENQEQVLIVGGRWGEKVAVLFDFYACQSNRYFLPTKYMAFYYDKRIKYLFEIEKSPIPSIELTDPQLRIDGKYFSIYDKKYKTSSDKAREFFQLKLVHIFPDSGIVNDLTDKNGNPCAFVQRQRYTTIEKIMSAKNTSDL